MKNGILKKIRSNRGATMLMALLLMLVGLMVSAVVISAAVSTVAGVRSGKEQQQAYLTVESAAQLFRDTLEENGKKYEIRTVRIYEYWPYNDQTKYTETDNRVTVPSGPFSTVLMDSMDYVIHGLPTDFKGTYQITVDEEAYAAVTLEITVTPRYQVIDQKQVMVGCDMRAEFYTSPDSEKGLCRMTLTADAEVSSSTYSYGTDRREEIRRSITWGSPTLETPKTAVTGGNG